MIIRTLRFALWAGGITLLLVAGISCDVLNPALVGDLGGNTTTTGPQPNGSVVVAFRNQRGIPLTLNYTFETTRAGAVTTTTQNFNNSGASMSLWAISHDCNTTKISITGISAGSSTDGGTGTADLPLAITFEKPNLTCGSVVFVNVPLVGSPTAELLP